MGEGHRPESNAISTDIKVFLPSVEADLETESYAPPMHIVDDFDRLMEALTELEGDDWRQKQDADFAANRSSEYSPYGVRAAFSDGIMGGGNSVIYGMGGFNRYAVHRDTGMVRMLPDKIAASPESKERIIERAKQLGLIQE